MDSEATCSARPKVTSGPLGSAIARSGDPSASATQPGGLVGGVGDDAGALIAGPLPPGSFRLGQAFGGPARQTVRVGEQPLSAIANVKRPQAGDRVIPRPATEEQHGATVSGDGETVWCPEAEAAGPGQLAGERRRGHAYTVPHVRGAVADA